MKQLYLKIQELLKEIPEIKWVDFDLGQMQEEMPSVAFPCVLIDIDFPTTENIDSHLQHVQANFNISLHTKIIGETNRNAPKRVQEQALSYLDLVDKITAKIQGYADTNFYSFERKSIRQTAFVYGVKTTIISFDTSFHEVIQ